MARPTSLIIASHNCLNLEQGCRDLTGGANPVDVVENCLRATEDNPDDHSVGYSGWPNLLGQVECDASIMDGRTLRSGAVGALQGYRHPISVARAVMERLVHVLLVGEGAARFAAEIGAEPREMLSPEARQRWRQQLQSNLGIDDPDALTGRTNLSELGKLAVDPEKVGGTVTCIARRTDGHLVAGVSTSGFAWKYPGRLGDSPIVGAGSYADDRYGAAACTGYGEWTISCGTARSVVLYMKMGMSVEEAVAEAMRDLQHVALPIAGVAHLIAMDRDGNHVGATTEPEQANRCYICSTSDDPAPQRVRQSSIPAPADSPAGRAPRRMS